MLQTLQLGILGSEVLLPSESRSMPGLGGQEFLRQGRAIDGTLHVDFINNKKSFTIAWGVIGQDNIDVLDGIYQSQFSNGSFLNFIISNVSGGESNYTVKMSQFNSGLQAQLDDWYYSGVTIQLEEV